jgi:non-specific serine/threonine protein kinase
MALTFEVLRNVNSAQVQGTQVAGNGPVLTMRRAVALMGLNGLRQASASLRTWPGPLSESGAVALRKLMDEVRLAATLSQWFRPAGYDSEVVFLLGLMQNLGRLMCRYHFPDDAEQIASLMRPGPLTSDGREQPGMQQDAASFAVMGIDIETLGVAVARQWGMPEDVLHMIRRLPSDRPVRSADSDADLLRATASAANDVVDVVTRLSGPQVNVALAGIAQRYHRLLGLTPRDITDALQQARQAMQAGSSIAAAVANTQAPSTSTQRPAGAARSATSSDKPVSPLRERAAASNLRQP